MNVGVSEGEKIHVIPEAGMPVTENQTQGPLQEQLTLLTAQPSLQHPNFL